MGKHRRPYGDAGSSSDEPTDAPHFWEPDPQYEPENKRPRYAVWALVLCLGLAFVVVGIESFSFGASRSDSVPDVVVHTVTVTVTPKSHEDTAVPSPAR